jgi:nucleotide-binding universal stress UspA family protein
MTKRKVLIPLDGSTFSSQILHVVRDYFRPEDVDIVLMRVSTPVLLTAESRSYAGVMAEQAYMGMYGNYTPQQEHLWAMSAQESDTYRKELQEDLEREAAQLREQGYRVSTEVHFGDPAQRIVDFVNDMSINVVAMTTHGRTGLGRLVLGSVAERVLRGVHVPVLLWRNPAPSQTPIDATETLVSRLAQRKPLQIAVATDGSTFAMRAVGLARNLTECLGAQLTLLVTANEQSEVTASQQRMQNSSALVATLGASAQVVPLVGYTDEVILNYLNVNPVDFLVIGAFNDRGAGSARATGITAHRLIQHAPTSVLMMKGETAQIRRILVAAALDDDIVVKVASSLAQQLGAQLDLFHVVPQPAATGLPTTEDNEIVLHEVMAQQNKLAAVVDAWRTELALHGFGEEQLHLYAGDALHTVLDFAHRDLYDLIVVGSQSGPGHFLGSVANGVVQFADQSVFVVRT